MANTTTEILTVDGVTLNTYAKNISSLAGRLRTPPVRGGNITIPGRHGALRVKQKYFGENVIMLPMWVRGSDDDGVFGATATDRRNAFEDNLSALTSLFGNRTGLLDVRHTLPDGSIRQCFAEVLEVLDFTPAGSWWNPTADVVVALNVPDAFWQDTADVTYSVSNPTVPSTLSMTQFAGATAPMEELIFTITGPITNPEIEAYENSAALEVPVWFKYTGALTAGQQLIVNCKTWAISGAGGFTPVYANFSHAGSSRFMTVYPAPAAGTPQVRIKGSGVTTGHALSVVGRRKYLVG